MSSTFELPHHISHHIRTPAELAMIADENWRKSQAQKKAPKVVIYDDPSVKPIDMGKLKRERLKKEKRIARKALAKSKAKKTKKVEVKEVEVKFMAKKKVVVKKYAYQSRKRPDDIELEKKLEEFRDRVEKTILGHARWECKKLMAEAEAKVKKQVGEYKIYIGKELKYERRKEHDKKRRLIRRALVEREARKGGRTFTFKEIHDFAVGDNEIGKDGDIDPEEDVNEKYSGEIYKQMKDAFDWEDDDEEDEEPHKYYYKTFKGLFKVAYEKAVKGKYFRDIVDAFSRILEMIFEEFGDDGQFLEYSAHALPTHYLIKGKYIEREKIASLVLSFSSGIHHNWDRHYAELSDLESKNLQKRYGESGIRHPSSGGVYRVAPAWR